MPTYDYICNTCGERFEHFQSMASQPLTQKPNCVEDLCNVKRVVSGGTGLIFKGSGFYLTDYKNKNKNNDANKSKQSNSKHTKKSETTSK